MWELGWMPRCCMYWIVILDYFFCVCVAVCIKEESSAKCDRWVVALIWSLILSPMPSSIISSISVDGSNSLNWCHIELNKPELTQFSAFYSASFFSRAGADRRRGPFSFFLSFWNIKWITSGDESRRWNCKCRNPLRLQLHFIGQSSLDYSAQYQSTISSLKI